MEIMYVLPVLAVLVSFSHLFISKKPRTKDRVVEIFLMYFLVILVGLSSIWAFMGHAFASAEVAAYIGWPAGSPFQFEVACANLALGVIGIMCLKFRDNFWTATVTAFTIFYWGAAYGHVMDMIQHGNHAPGNVGAPIYFDIILPTILIVLLVAHKILEKNNQKQ
ncbi:hypothetical protein DSECCO2_138800 [anaerobic digester metagenome]